MTPLRSRGLARRYVIGVEVGDEPWVKDTEPGASFNAVHGQENRKKPVVERLASWPFFGEAGNSDMLVVGGKLVVGVGNL